MIGKISSQVTRVSLSCRSESLRNARDDDKGSLNGNSRVRLQRGWEYQLNKFTVHKDKSGKLEGQTFESGQLYGDQGYHIPTRQKTCRQIEATNTCIGVIVMILCLESYDE